MAPTPQVPLWWVLGGPGGGRCLGGDVEETSPEAERGLGPGEQPGFPCRSHRTQRALTGTRSLCGACSALRRLLVLTGVSHLGPCLSCHTPRSSLQLPGSIWVQKRFPCPHLCLPPTNPTSLPDLLSSYCWNHAALSFRNLASFLNSSIYF